MKNTVNIENRKAKYDYFIEETLECGIELKGNEVKSIRYGSCAIVDAWCSVKDNQLFIYGMFIDSYKTANEFDILNQRRERRLLAHKKEIINLANKVALNGMTLIPLKVYESGNKIKVLVGLCKGKHTYDKRQTLKDRQAKRDIERNIKR